MGASHVITGGLGYTGRAMVRSLLGRGERVRTLTNSGWKANPFGDRLDVRPLDFGDGDGLRRSLGGAASLTNTYWVRFNHRRFNHRDAVANTKRLFTAARDAGVERIVHVSILNPRGPGAAGLSYYDGKAELEAALDDLGVEHAVIRPGVVFGRGDILVNNIAWALRRLPVFGVFGDGAYGVRPIHVDDFAELAVACAMGERSGVIDAVGPERFTYAELVRTLARIIGVRRAIVRTPKWAGWLVAAGVGRVVGDAMLTREEIAGLAAGLLDSNAQAAGGTVLTAWAEEHRETLGRRYASEMARRQ